MKLKKGQKVNEFRAYINTHVLNDDNRTPMVQQIEVESFEDLDGKILQFTLASEKGDEFFCNLNESQVKVLKSMIEVYLSYE